jgi:hypothetical protein
LQAKIAPDEAEDDSCGDPTTKDDNDAWRDLRRNPSGTRQRE